MPIILGIDASLTSTGWAVLTSGEFCDTGVISIKGLQGVERLLRIEEELLKLISNRNPNLIAIEGYAYGRQNQSHQMGELGGVLRVAMTKAGVKWIEVAPTAVKKFATGKGNAKKEQIILEVYKRWGAEFKTNDQADAFVLAQIGHALYGRTQKLTKFQQEVVDELAKKSGLDLDVATMG